MFKKYVFVILLFMFSSMQINAMIDDHNKGILGEEIIVESIFSLPNEIKDMIYQYLNEDEKKALLQVCKFFYIFTIDGYLIPNLLKLVNAQLDDINMDDYYTDIDELKSNYNRLITSLVEKDWRVKKDIFYKNISSRDYKSILSFIVIHYISGAEIILNSAFKCYKQVSGIRSSKQNYYASLKKYNKKYQKFWGKKCPSEYSDLNTLNGFIKSGTYHYGDGINDDALLFRLIKKLYGSEKKNIYKKLKETILLKIKEKYGEEAIKNETLKSNHPDRDNIKFEIYARSMIILWQWVTSDEGYQSFTKLLVDFENYIKTESLSILTEEKFLDLIGGIKKISKHPYHITWCDMLDTFMSELSIKVTEAEDVEE